MKSKRLNIAIAILAAVIILAGTFSGGVIAGYLLPDQRGNQPILQPSQPSLSLPTDDNSIPSEQVPSEGATSEPAQPQPTSMPPQNIEDLFKPFWQTWDIVHDQYVDQPVDDLAMMRGAIRGMLESLNDQHTSYMDPDQFRQANTPLQGEYEGIGAWVDLTGEFLVITSPIPNTPAEKAGLRPGDTVIKVDGEDMTGVDGNLVLRKILGPAGTPVTLTIQREGQEPFDVTITRAKITIPSVESKMLDNNIAYVRLNTYGEKTANDLHQVLKDLLKDNPKGLIFDLRNNGGGYLTTAIEVVSEFLTEGQVAMYEIRGDGSRDTFVTQAGGLATEIPMIVLVNEGTASASEITAGALQDHQRAKLVGVTTYGKGSVQNWIPLAGDQGAVRVTIARWVTPKERQIHEIGLTPDVVVELTEADFEAGRDPQLDKAVELLNQ